MATTKMSQTIKETPTIINLPTGRTKDSTYLRFLPMIETNKISKGLESNGLMKDSNSFSIINFMIKQQSASRTHRFQNCKTSQRLSFMLRLPAMKHGKEHKNWSFTIGQDRFSTDTGEITKQENVSF